MLLAVLSCFAVALVAPLLRPLVGNRLGLVAALLPASLFAYFLGLSEAVQRGEVVRETHAWVPTLGVEVAMHLDGLSLLFALLITGIGTLVFIYAGGYLKDDPYLGRFFLYINLFMGSMLGLVLSSNLIVLFVFWELTSISSYLLIGFKHEKQESRDSALQALLITAGGGLALLGGFVLMGVAGGTFEITELFARREDLHTSPLYVGMVILVLAGAFTKSAQFPFHFWLPGAMAAPTPVSAYLHSATMVKAGVYLLARLNSTLGGSELWTILVGGAGGLTLLVAAYLALAHTDLKSILAYTTVAALGTLVFLVGLGTPVAMEAFAVFLLVHALYKAALFMVAGSIDHEAGSRDLLKVGGLRRIMPISFVTAVLAAASMAGLIPLLGFIGKELIYEAALEFPHSPWLLTAVAVIANVAVGCAALIVAFRPFLGPVRAPDPARVHEAPPSMWIGPLLLATLGFGLGIAPAFIDARLLVPTASAVLGEVLEFDVYLWHGFNLVLGLSVLTLVLGVTLFLFWDRLRGAFVVYDRALAETPKRLYGGFLAGCLGLAAITTGLLQNGLLRTYLSIMTVFTVLLVGGTLLLRGGVVFAVDTGDTLPYEWMVLALMIAGAITAAVVASRLGAILALGVVGFSVALVFVFFGGPDVAITQFFVETLTVILVVLVLLRLPRYRHRSSGLARARDAGIAAAAGATVTMLLLAVLQTPLDTRLSEYFAENSYPVAQGRNIVNVILVDFRALDTLGEIAVLAAAGIGVFALVKLVVRRAEVKR